LSGLESGCIYSGQKESRMPVYEYACKDCGTRFESLRSMREADSPIACQHCASLNTTRKLSLFCAQSGGKAIAGSSSGCQGCSGGSCSSCGHG
jgi:putative FmdB family regulatory protein